MIEWLVAGAGAYAAASGALYAFQRRLVFNPIGAPGEPAAAGVSDMSWVTFPSTDGLTLRAWFKPPASDRPTIVYFHGNTGHFGERAFKARHFLDHGYGFLLTSYRGFSGNPGRPAEAQVYDDGRAALAFLRAQGIAPGRTVIYGESLGTGIAVEMAREHDAGALVLEAPFTSLVDVAAHHYWWTPARALLRDRFASIEKIGAIDMPLLIVHGERDRTVPVKFGKRLYAAAAEPKELRLLPGARHVDVFDFGAGEAIHAFLVRRL